jgi:hypothetical protein
VQDQAAPLVWHLMKVVCVGTSWQEHVWKQTVVSTTGTKRKNGESELLIL